MRRFATCLLLLSTLPASSALADESKPPAKAEKAQPERVHLGSASVTVVDEHEAVDDVISRIRNAKTEPPATVKTAEPLDQGAKNVTATDSRKGSGRSSLRVQRDRASARVEADRIKDERRERAASTRTRLEQKQRR